MLPQINRNNNKQLNLDKVIQHTWIDRIFTTKLKDHKRGLGAGTAFGLIISDKKSPFFKSS